MIDHRVARGGWRTDARYRTVPEREIRDALVLAGWAFEHRAGQGGLDEAATAALDRLVAKSLPYRTVDAERCFDPVEVLNFLKWCGLSGSDTFWMDRFVSTGRRLVAEAASHRATSQTMSVALRRTFNLVGLPRDRAVRLRLPLPVPHASLAHLHLDVMRADGLHCIVAGDGCRLEARGVVHEKKRLSVSVLLSVTLNHSVPDREPGSLERYLEPNEGLVRVTPRVRDLSAALAGTSTGRWQIVECFFDYFLDHLCLGAVHYDQVEAGQAPTDWVLETGWFDCQLGSALLVALCRARSIPARLVGGFLLYPTAPTLHFWTEVWFPDAGWLAFDLTCWDLAEGGREPGWRHHFAGRTDARLTMQRMPLQFTGSPGIPISARWHVLSAATPTGARTGLYQVEAHQLIYEDDIAVSFDSHVARQITG